jgi:beta-glucanase (GH16 family)
LLDRSGSYGYPHSSRLAFHQDTHPKTRKNLIYSVLVWADEFDQDTIDGNNWNLQVVEAGRFNAEWQRYTNSSENAYIDNDCLVIKAIHDSDVHGMDQYTSARLNTADELAEFHEAFFILLNLAVGGTYAGRPDASTRFPQYLYVDWVRVYQKS